MKITGDEPYYPFITYNEGGCGNAVVIHTELGEQYIHYEPGITIHQHFAESAMAAIISNSKAWTYKEVARGAIKMANALIEELNKTEE